MPAAAVIPALRVYMNVVAVKKPVVGFEDLVPCLDLKSSDDGPPSYAICQGSETCGTVHRQFVRVKLSHVGIKSGESRYPHSVRCAHSRHCE